MRVCLIGVSGFGDTHYNMLLREQMAGRADIVGATVINAGEEAEKCAKLRSLGAEVFSSSDAMFERLAGKADLCMIPTGIALHRPMTEAALTAGMHVLVEKPAAGSIQDVRAMQAAADRAGLTVAVGFQDLYNPLLLTLKQALLEGRVGDIESIRICALWPRTHEYYGRNSWAGALRAGSDWVLDSPANNANAHELLMSLFLAGTELTKAAVPETVEAELYHANPIASADTVNMRISTASGIPIYAAMSHACSPNGTGAWLKICGSRGSVDWSRERAEIHTADRITDTLDAPPIELIRENMIDAIRRKAAGEPAFLCDLEMASMQTLVINGAHEASVIHAFPEACVSEIKVGESSALAIDGISDLGQRSVTEGKLFSELGAPWAKPAGTFSLAGYERFDGGKAL